jgi:hypothetical protein
MIQVRSRHPLSRVSTALHRYAHQHRATIQTIHMGRGPCPVVFLLTYPDFQHRLAQADRRWLTCLPWHVAGGEEEAGGTYLETLSPLEVCKWLNLDPTDVPAEFEKFLTELLDHAAQALGEGIHIDSPHQSEHYGLGATELQVNQRATVPQRIDNKGTKVEELAGTGQHDAQGG